MSHILKLVFYFLCVQVAFAKSPKNIILFIGDGMGPTQITAARTVKGELALEKFNVSGYVLTHSTNKYITDSAAGATAFATGYKTYNGAISVHPETKKPLKTILEFAEEKGKSSGLIATSSVTHATPACFAAHVTSRSKQQDIAAQIAVSGVDVLIGGGLGYFLPRDKKGSKRSDKKDLLDKMQGYEFANSYAEFRKVATPEKLVALLETGHLHKAKDRKISLGMMTMKALNILSQNENGFFLMVEGSQIDWAGHDNKKKYLMTEMVDFDDAIGIAQKFAANNEETLVLVTADHETGGLALLGGSLAEKKVNLKFIDGHHTGVMVPVFAFGPGAEAFGGIQENHEIGKKMIGLFNSETN
ncbi:MAG: alkaline phosphatase [Calditrichaeota bacterium]|nr:MAG: alkaline phosphatase [Calditrichota bacterium]